MPTYIVLGNFTAQGLDNIDDVPEQFERVEELKRSLNGELRDVFLTFGQYDFVAYSEMPDDRSAARVNLTAAKGGDVRTETLRAFTVDETRDILEGLSE